MTQAIVDERSVTHLQFETAMNKAMYFLPVHILVPVIFGAAFYFSGTFMDWKAFGLGALGWTIALFLRGPLSAIVMKSKMSKEKATTIIVGSSGVFEECVRLSILMLTGMTYSWSLSVGQGWAAVEVLYTMIYIIIMYTLAKRTDEKAMQAKEMIRMQGYLNASPLWGVIERIFSSGLHIGFTLLVAKFPWAVVLLIPIHSFVNLTSIRLMKKSIIQVESIIALVGTIALAIGIIISH